MRWRRRAREEQATSNTDGACASLLRTHGQQMAHRNAITAVMRQSECCSRARTLDADQLRKGRFRLDGWLIGVLLGYFAA